MILKRGDFVWLANEKQRVRAMVTLASPNGDSLMVMFASLFQMKSGAAYAGMMPLLRKGDGEFHDLVNDEQVQVSQVE